MAVSQDSDNAGVIKPGVTTGRQALIIAMAQIGCQLTVAAGIPDQHEQFIFTAPDGRVHRVTLHPGYFAE